MWTPASLPAGVHLVRGDPTDEAAIKEAKPAGAEQALITGKSDGDVLVSAVLTRKQAPDLLIIALVNSASVREALQDLGVQQVMSSHKLIASTLAKSLEAPHAADMLAQLVESNTHRIGEIDADAVIIGKRLSAVRDGAGRPRPWPGAAGKVHTRHRRGPGRPGRRPAAGRRSPYRECSVGLTACECRVTRPH